jgi:predicted PurR-regulated permease PerM
MESKSNNLTKIIVDNIIKIGFIAIIIGWCLKILTPFLGPVLWAVLIAVI